jgi:hypothetical protein
MNEAVVGKPYLEKRLERMEGIYAIHNLMGRYEFLLAADRPAAIRELFANREDTSWDIEDLGIFKGEQIMQVSLLGEDN